MCSLTGAAEGGPVDDADPVAGAMHSRSCPCRPRIGGALRFWALSYRCGSNRLVGWLTDSAARAAQKRAAKRAVKDARVKRLARADETFIHDYAMLTRDRQWYSFLWSDAALYYGETDDFHSKPVTRVGLDQISAVAHGQPPRGTYGFLETPHPIWIVMLKNPPVLARRSHADGRVEDYRLQEIPALACSNDTGQEQLFAALRRAGVKVDGLPKW